MHFSSQSTHSHALHLLPVKLPVKHYLLNYFAYYSQLLHSIRFTRVQWPASLCVPLAVCRFSLTAESLQRTGCICPIDQNISGIIFPCDTFPKSAEFGSCESASDRLPHPSTRAHEAGPVAFAGFIGFIRLSQDRVHIVCVKLGQSQRFLRKI